MIELENSLANSMCLQFEEGVVCPARLRKGLHTAGALDNLDHNPSSTTAQGSLHEKAATLAMVKHGMDIQKKITNCFNPGQIPVMAFDQLLFALAKYVQWSWPQLLGEDHFVVMFGGLHIEMALWSTIGDFLDCSGWTSTLCEAGVATSGTADSFLKATHLTRTRRSHQITALVLSKLRQHAWEKAVTTHGDLEKWRSEMIAKSPTVQFWDLVLEFEILVLIFIRAHRSNDFNLFVESLEALVPWFFALDHINYSRWIPIHIRDMKSLPDAIREDFKKFWVVPKTRNKFSSMPIDQAHEQNNQLVKGLGGAVGLTENPVAFRRWSRQDFWLNLRANLNCIRQW